MLILAGGVTAQVKTISSPTDLNNSPEVENPIPNIEALVDAEDINIDLNAHFYDPNDSEATLTYEITGVSNASVAELTLSSEVLSIDFLAQGQTNVFITASNNGLSCIDTFVIGVRPVIEGGYVPVDSFISSLIPYTNP